MIGALLAGWLLSWVPALASPAPLVAPQGGAQANGCATCHGTEARELNEGTHLRSGLRCTDCHGGQEGVLDKQRAHGPALRALKEPRQIVESCGGCHSNIEHMQLAGLRTDQLALYSISAHGKALAKDPKAEVASCATCHGAHRIVPPTDSRSPVHRTRQIETCGKCHADAALGARHGFDSSVVSAFRDSIHGQMLLHGGSSTAPGCTDCHGSHAATPPGVKDLGMVCGRCHALIQQQFERSPHFAAAQRGEIGECVCCHGDHGVAATSPEMLVGGKGSTCGACHRDSADKALVTARRLYDELQGLDRSIEETEGRVIAAAQRGLFIEEESGYLEDARSLRARTKAIVHSLSPDALGDLVNRARAMVLETQERLEVKARKLRDRRIFTAIFFGVLLAFAGVLQVHRRQLRGAWERRPTAGG